MQKLQKKELEFGGVGLPVASDKRLCYHWCAVKRPNWPAGTHRIMWWVTGRFSIDDQSNSNQRWFKCDTQICVGSLTHTQQGFLFTQISGHSPIKILKVRNISKLQDNFSIYWCWFYMPLVHLKSKCPVTKFSHQKPCADLRIIRFSVSYHLPVYSLSWTCGLKISHLLNSRSCDTVS